MHGTGSRWLGWLVALALVASACGGGTAVEDRQSLVGQDTATPTAVVEPPATPSPTEAPAPTTNPEPTEASAPSATPTADAGSTTTGEPDREQLVADLQAELDAWLEASTAPGVSLSISLPGQDPINLAAGVADLATGEPVETTDYFRIASITKPMTAALILTLVDEGLVELDAPVSTYLGADWLGNHPNAADITVAQLMNHTNGLIEYAFDIGFYLEAASRQDQPYAPEEILEFLSRQDPLFAPGEAYQYETGGFVAAGLIIEAVTGNTAAEEMRARLFEPAGADTIFLTPQEFPPEPVVHAYARGELYAALRLLVPEQDLGQTVGADDPVIDVLAGEQAVLQSAGWTGGGNEAQMQSVAAVFKAMFDGTVLSDDAIASMTDTVLDSGYGLGLDVNRVAGELVYRHGGGVPGFRSQAGYLPEHDISYAFSANLIPLPDGTDVSRLTEAMVPLLVAATTQDQTGE